MSEEKKRSMTFKWIEKDLASLYDFIGFSENSGEYFGNSMEKKLRKLVFDTSSPAPDSPSGEQKPQVNKTVEQKLYDQYLEDMADFKFPKPSEKPETPAPSPLDFVEQHECHYRATVKEKDGSFSIYCDTKKIPLEVCITRQKRFLFMKKNCKPIGYKPPQKQRTQQDHRTRPYKGDTDGYVDTFDIGDGFPNY